MTAQTKTFSELISFTRASNATYFDSAGVLRRAASNVSRIDYNPSTLAVRGLLVEEQRTNLLTYSEYFDNAAWTKTRCSISPNATTAPNGSLSADKIIENTDNNTHAIERNASGLTGGATYTQTIFVKAAERTRVVIGGWDGTTGIDNQFNLLTGTVEASGAGTIAASIDSVGSGWYRCRVTRAIAAGATQLSLVVYTHNGTNNTYAGDGSSGLFIWGAQIELGAFPTSYIPSSVTFSGRTSNGTYFDSTGTLQTAGSGVSRTTYNPSNLTAEPFLLLEESRTNSIRNNTMAGVVVNTGTLPTNWAISSIGLSTQIIGVGTEKGIYYIDLRISGTTTGQFGGLFFETATGIATTASIAWSTSVYLKLVAGTLNGLSQVGLGMYYFDSTPTIITNSTIQTTLTSFLTRYSLTATTPASTAYNRPLFYFNGTNSSGDKVDFTLRIGMPQLEQGAFPTSVISTSSAAVTRAADTSTSATATRAADDARIDYLSPWYNETEGTIYSETVLSRQNAYSGNNTWYITDGISTEIRTFYRAAGTTGAIVYGPASNQADLTLTGVIAGNTIVKLALAYKTNDFAAAGNGGAVSTDNTGTVPYVTKLYIGNFGYLNGWIIKLKYYPRRLTNAELQAITT